MVNYFLQTWLKNIYLRYEFNDVIVRDFNLDDLANEAYGVKNRNAYLLFYERKKKYHPNGTEITEIK